MTINYVENCKRRKLYYSLARFTRIAETPEGTVLGLFKNGSETIIINGRYEDVKGRTWLRAMRKISISD